MTIIKRALLALLTFGTTAFGQVTFTGRIDGPNDVDRYSLTAPSGDFSVLLSPAAGLQLYVGLYSGQNLLAMTGPNENLYAQGPGGAYSLVVMGDGVGNYSLSVPTGTVPEPATGGAAVLGMYLLGRRRR